MRRAHIQSDVLPLGVAAQEQKSPTGEILLEWDPEAGTDHTTDVHSMRKEFDKFRNSLLADISELFNRQKAALVIEIVTGLSTRRISATAEPTAVVVSAELPHAQMRDSFWSGGEKDGQTQLNQCQQAAHTKSGKMVPRLGTRFRQVVDIDGRSETAEAESDLGMQQIKVSEDSDCNAGQVVNPMSTNDASLDEEETGTISPGRISHKSFDTRSSDSRASRYSRKRISTHTTESMRVSVPKAISVDSLQKNIALVRASVVAGYRKPGFDNGLIIGGINQLVHHSFFNHFITCTIFLNTLVIAVETEWRAHNVGRSEPFSLSFIDTCCSIIFVIELCLKLAVERSQFFLSKDWKWNLFDFIVVVFAILEFILSITKTELDFPGGTVLRALRILRVVRTVRVLRVATFFRELRIMIHGVLNCLLAFSWLLLLLMFVMLVCAIFITHGVTDHKYEIYENDWHWDSNIRLLDQHFGSICKSLFSLFKVISGGENWGVYSDALLRVSVLSATLFMLYIAFVTFAVLNIVTGIFVNFSTKAAEEDVDTMVLERITHQQKLINEFCKVFRSADKENTGYLSCEQFVSHISDPNVQAFLKFIELDIELYDPAKLFKLLDFSGARLIGLEEFVMGLSKFRGIAKSLDLAALHSDVKAIAKKLSHLTGSLQRVRLPSELSDAFMYDPTMSPTSRRPSFASKAVEHLRFVQYEDDASDDSNHAKTTDV